MVKLSDRQAQKLLDLYLTGNFGGCPFSVYQSLERKGYITLGRNVTVTVKGKLWCDENHVNVVSHDKRHIK